MGASLPAAHATWAQFPSTSTPNILAWKSEEGPLHTAELEGNNRMGPLVRPHRVVTVAPDYKATKLKTC